LNKHHWNWNTKLKNYYKLTVLNWTLAGYVLAQIYHG